MEFTHTIKGEKTIVEFVNKQQIETFMSFHRIGAKILSDRRISFDSLVPAKTIQQILEGFEIVHCPCNKCSANPKDNYCLFSPRI